MTEPDFPHYPDDKPVIHYCWVCDVEEECREMECDFREQYKVHGYCMANVKKLIDKKLPKIHGYGEPIEQSTES